MSCSSSSAGQRPRSFSEDSRVKVLSTTAMIDDIVGRIGLERIDSIPLMIGEVDPHSYELVKGDDEKIQRAQVVFFNGLNLEHGASLRYKIEKHPLAVGVGDYILNTHPEVVLSVDGEIDPHVWMDISAWQYIIDPIVEALVQADPEGKLYYEENARRLRAEMLLAHERVKDSIHQISSEKRYLVTSHDAFRYFARSYLSTEEERISGDWVRRFAAPEGLAPEGQLSAADLQKILDHLCTHRISVVFPESNVSRDSLRKIVMACKEKKTEVRFSMHPLYGDSMGSPESIEGTYLGMIEHNASILVREWQ